MSNKDLLQILVGVFAAILAASITTFLSITNRKNEWTNALRNEMSGFMASTSNMNETYTYLKHRAALELLLNPKKAEQQNLIDFIDSMAKAVETMHYRLSNKDIAGFEEAVEVYKQAAQFAVVQYRMVVKIKNATWLTRNIIYRFRKVKTMSDLM